MYRFLHGALVAIALVSLSIPAHAATLTVAAIARGGVAVAGVAAAAAGDECANDGRTVLRISNSSGANAYTVTVGATRTVDGLALAGQTITVATSGHVIAGPFPSDTFNTSAGRIGITYAGSAPATDLTVQCLRLPER